VTQPLSDVKRALLELRLKEERERLRAREERLRPLVPLQPEGDRPPFFCIHASSGSAFPYVGLATRVGRDQPFYGLESPGLDDGARPLATFEEMAAVYAAAVTEQQPAGPYRIGGWSIGAIIALEMARQLRAAGHEVAQLVMIDTALLDRDDPADPIKCIRWFTHDLASMAGAPTPDVEHVLTLPLGPRLLALRELLVERGLVPAEIDRVAFERRVAVHESNILAFHRYRPARYDGEVAVLFASGSGFDHRIHELLHGDAPYQVLPGDHYTILRPPHVDALATRVRRALEIPMTGDVP
jgi:thioesterase domain-containing protein